MDKRLLLLCLLWRYRRNKRKRQRSVWVREIFQKRRHHGDFHQLLQEMRLCDSESHFRYLRMTKATFDLLLSLVGPLLHRRRLRKRILISNSLYLLGMHLKHSKIEGAARHNDCNMRKSRVGPNAANAVVKATLYHRHYGVRLIITKV